MKFILEIFYNIFKTKDYKLTTEEILENDYKKSYHEGKCCLIKYKNNKVEPVTSGIYINNNGKIFGDEHQLRARIAYITK